MSNDSYIPIYKRSGDGTAKDLLKLKKLEMISDGWYKGKLASYLEKVAGKIIVDGVECYNTNIIIGSYTSKSDNSQYAKDLKELLKLLGLSDNALESIYNTSLNSQVNGIFLNFNKNINSNREFSEFDFKQTFINIKEQLSNAYRFELIHSNKHYTSDTVIRPAERMSDIYTGSKWVEDLDFFDSLQDYNTICDENGCVGYPIEIVRDFSISQSLHFTEVKIYNNLNQDITNNYPELLVNALKVCLAFSSTFAEFQSIEKTSEQFKEYDNGEGSIYEVTSKESYLNNISSDFLDEYDEWKNGSLEVETTWDSTDDGGGTYTTINGIIAMHYWSFYLIIDALDNDESNDLFYISKRKKRFLGKTYYDELSTRRYITVNGFKKTNAKVIASYLSQYSDFSISQKEKKRKFLGVGGFVGSFLGGIFELILQGIGFIAEILYYIPIVRIQIQAIAWMFSGKWSNDKDRFKQVATRLIIAIIAAVIIVLTGGGGWQIALSLLTSAYTMYTGLKEYDDTVAYVKKQAEIEATKKLEDEEDEDNTYEEMINLANTREGLEYANKMTYNPFNGINDTYRSPFNSGVYSPEMGLKMKG